MSSENVAANQSGSFSNAGTLQDALREFFPEGSFPHFGGNVNTWLGADNSSGFVNKPKRNVVIELIGSDGIIRFFNPHWGVLAIGKVAPWKSTPYKIHSVRYHWESPGPLGVVWWPHASNWLNAAPGKNFLYVEIKWGNGDSYTFDWYEVH